MKFILSIIAILSISCPGLHAGGGSFPIQIVSLTPKEDGEYRLEFMQLEAPYSQKLAHGPKRIVVHLQYAKTLFPPDYPHVSQEKYQAAIAMLKAQATKKEKSRLGVMAQGYLPIKGKDNEYQSNALSIFEQSDGKQVVFSFPRKL